MTMHISYLRWVIQRRSQHLAVAHFINLDLDPSPLVDFQEARSVLRAVAWLPLVLVSVPRHRLVRGVVNTAFLTNML